MSMGGFAVVVSSGFSLGLLGQVCELVVAAGVQALKTAAGVDTCAEVLCVRMHVRVRVSVDACVCGW